MSEARGYIPMITPQQVVLASKNLPPVSAEPAPPSSSTTATATSGVGNGPTGSVADIPLKDTPTKDKDSSTAKSEETGKFSVGVREYDFVCIAFCKQPFLIG